jgi:hypothetical protein
MYELTVFESPTLKALNSIAQGKRRSRATLGYEILNQINPVRVALDNSSVTRSKLQL